MKLSRILIICLSGIISGNVSAHTDNYQDFYGTSGCRLMLCLQNPNGPMAVKECQKDVQAFYTELALAYYGHNVSIPVCMPSMKNGSFFTIGKVQQFVKVKNRNGGHVYKWVNTNQLSVSTYINNKPWRQWGFSGAADKVPSVGLLSDVSKNSNTFLRIIPFSAEGMEAGGPYASVLPKGYSLTQNVPNDDLLSKYTEQSSSRFSQYKNTETNEYIREWMKSTGYKLK